MRGQESSYITLHALLRAPRFLSREILTLPRRRLSASLLHHGPPPATPRPMTYHPRDNATAHGPRDNVLPPATIPRRDNVPPPATQLPRRSPDNVTGRQSQAHGAPYASAVTRAPSDAAPHEATTNATTPSHRPTQQHRTTSHGRPSRASGRHIATPLCTNAATTGRGAKHHRAPTTP